MKRLVLTLLLVLTATDASAATMLSVDASATPPAPTTGYLHTGTTKSPSGHTIDVNSQYLLRDSQPWLPVMGEIHYTRIPNEYWDEELAKMKAAGVDVVSTYVIWQHHEETEGKFDWSGDRDLRKFIELCAKHGLYVIVRLGPWVHAEVRYGGIPDWVVAAMPTRRSDATYLHYVGRFYSQIGEQVHGQLWKDGGPVIGVQIENEYYRTGFEEGRGHIADLKQLALKAGFDVPLYTVTAWDNTIYPAREVTPVFGSYPDAPWAISPAKSPPNEAYAFRFKSRVTGDITPKSLAATAAGDADGDSANTPFLSAEYAGGLPSMYRRRTVVSSDDIASLLPIQIGSGVNLYGYYMFHGGRNPEGTPTREENTGIGGYNDLPALGYDFQAPLGEYGQMHDVLGKVRPWHYFLAAFGSELAPMASYAPATLPSGIDDYTTPRFSVRALGDRGFLFYSSHVRLYPMARQHDVQFRVKLGAQTLTFPSKPVDIPADRYFVWPLNMNLGGATLAYATAQPVTKLDSGDRALYVFRAVDGIPVEMAFDAVSVTSVIAAGGANQRVDGKHGRIVVSNIRPGTGAAVQLRTKAGVTIRVMVLEEQQAEQLWVLPLQGRERLLLTDALLFQQGDAVELRSKGEPHLRFEVYPAPAAAINASVSLSKGKGDGLFTAFEATLAARHGEVSVKSLRAAQPMPPIAIGGPAGSSLQPYPETFAKAAAWTLGVPKDALADGNDAFLQIRYTGDVIRLFSGTDMIDDAYYNGLVWEIGLKRFAKLLDKPFALTILPLRKDAPIYLEPEFVPKGFTDGQTAELQSVTLVPEYRLSLR